MKDLEKWKNLTQEEIEKIVENYIDKNQKLNEAGKDFNLNGSQVRDLLKANKIKQRKSCKDNRIYKVNDDYFDIQTPNMAYILGFWSADGNVHSTENRMDLELSSKDLEILEKIKEELKCERPIKIYQCSNGYEKNKLFFWSAKLKQKFIEYGVVPNKTYSEDFSLPYKLDKKYWIDYIRGFFDGDGCIKKFNSITFELNSVNRNFLVGIKDFLKQYYDIDTQISEAGKKVNLTVYRLYCYGEQAKKVFSVLYTPNSLYLKRKYDKWLELI